MKKTCIAALVSFAVFSGCGVGTEVEGEDVGVQREAVRSVYPIPAIPSSPTLYKSGVTKLYPKSVLSAVTYVAASDTNPDEFEAWGYDVVSRECVFYVRANVKLFDTFESDVKSALDLVPKNNPAYLGNTIQGQPLLPRPIGPGGTWALSVNAVLHK